MNVKNVVYWVVTGLLAFALSGSAAMDLTMPPDFAAGMAHLGYPAYFPAILGVWKVLGVVALLAPGFPRVKEWAYAGIFFDLTGAVASHVAVGDAGGAGPAAVLTALLVASYLLRPPTRVLGRLPALAGSTAGAPVAG